MELNEITLEIKNIAEQIIQKYRPMKIILFGSAARKEYDEVNEEFVYNISKIHLTIVDCRSLDGWCTCRFNTEGHLPGATLFPARGNYTSLYYNVTSDTNDILIYTTDGKNGERFCENLTGNVYGKLYNLVGGFNSWKTAGYPIEPVYLS